MRILVLALPTFLIALAGHLVWWRIRLPHRRLPALLSWFSFVFISAACGMFLAKTNLPPLPHLLHATLFYWAMVCAYLITYSSYLEVDSPTLSLMKLIGERDEGIAIGQVEKLLGSRPFVAARVETLKEAGLVAECDGKLVKCGRPPMVFHILLLWRRWLRVIECTG